LNPGQVKSKTEKLAPAAFLVSIRHLWPRAGMVGQVTGWGIMFICIMVLAHKTLA